tara:strand:- start:1439 stop:1870 length:432 start_codon:yes stop_codon:yes gene_type:complete
MNFETERNRLERMSAELVLCLSQFDQSMLLDLCLRCDRDRFLRQTWRDHRSILSALKKLRLKNWTPPKETQDQENAALVLLAAAYILRVALAYLHTATEMQAAAFGQGKERGLRLADVAFQAHMQQPTIWPFDDDNDPFDEIF